jgi:hypothetical protein
MISTKEIQAEKQSSSRRVRSGTSMKSESVRRKKDIGGASLIGVEFRVNAGCDRPARGSHHLKRVDEVLCVMDCRVNKFARR